MLNVVKDSGEEFLQRRDCFFLYMCNGALVSSKAHQNNSLNRYKFARKADAFSFYLGNPREWKMLDPQQSWHIGCSQAHLTYESWHMVQLKCMHICALVGGNKYIPLLH